MPALPVNARGRASRSNESSRYDAFTRGSFDDGWTEEDGEPAQLETKRSYQPARIQLGANTDPYQPIERKLQITREILKVLARYKHPVGITTKNALVTRDIDILAPMAAQRLAAVSVSVTTLDRKLARAMEPRASTPDRRIEAIRQLTAAGQADGASLFQYAVGRLVLWVPADSSLDVEHQGMNVLLDPSVKKIAIANPQHAPYGRAAVAALKHDGMYDRVADRLVLGDNISQAAQFVESGNAQAGFVALAHAVAPSMRGKGKYWEVPVDAYPPLAQGVVLLSHSPHKKEAAEFLEYIKTKDSAELFRKYGFTLPQ